MNKLFYFFSIITFLLINSSILLGQERQNLLQDDISISYREYLQLRLDILSSQISNGSIYFIDLPSNTITNSININESGILDAVIYLDRVKDEQNLSKNTIKEIHIESLIYFKLCITTMMSKYFHEYKYNEKHDLIINAFYKSEGLHPSVFKYEKDEIIWESP